MWVARDKNKNLKIFVNKPNRINDEYNHNHYWRNNHEDDYPIMGGFIDNKLFPDLTWEDEPIYVEIDTRQSLITRMEILHTNYYQESNKFFDENPGKGFMSFDEYALKNWDNVDMDYFETIG